VRTEGGPTSKDVPVDQPAVDRSAERKRFRGNLVIFLSVNAALLVIWVALMIAGVDVRSPLWTWAVAEGLWILLLTLEARAAYRAKPREKHYSEERIRHEMRRMP
jgi:hypothetical protein